MFAIFNKLITVAGTQDQTIALNSICTSFAVKSPPAFTNQTFNATFNITIKQLAIW